MEKLDSKVLQSIELDSICGGQNTVLYWTPTYCATCNPNGNSPNDLFYQGDWAPSTSH